MLNECKIEAAEKDQKDKKDKKDKDKEKDKDMEKDKDREKEKEKEKKDRPFRMSKMLPNPITPGLKLDPVILPAALSYAEFAVNYMNRARD